MPQISAEIKPWLKEQLSDKRLEHCLRTAQTAKLLANIWQADETKAEIAGLLHDSARGFTEEEQKAYAKKAVGGSDPFLFAYPVLLHGAAAAGIAQEKWGILDQDILNALIHHTVGRPHMSLLEEVIFLADKTEPGRCFAGVDELRALSKKNIAAAMAVVLQNNLDYLQAKGKFVHPLAIKAAEYYQNLDQKGRNL